MAIYTPRGLKIRIAVPYAFGLMARLHPKVTPFRILKTTEGIESLPGMFAFVAGLVAFGLHLPPTQIALIVGICQLAGALINALGLYIIPGLVGLGTLYSYISGYGIYLIAVVITGFLLGGWQAVVAFFVGKYMDCSNFDTQAAAQQFFEAHQPGDPQRLDGNGDGQACESLP